MTLNLAQRSFKVIHFGSNRKHVYDFVQAVNSNCCSVSNRYGDIASFVGLRPEPIFPDPTPIPAKIWMFPLEYRSMTWGSAERNVRLPNQP